MGELTLICGPAFPGKDAPLLDRCRQRLEEGRGDSFIYLLPSQHRVRQQRRRLLAQTSAPLLSLPHLLDLGELLRRLHRSSPEPRLPLPSQARTLFAVDALRQLAPDLTYFRQDRSEPFTGLFRAATRLIAELEAADCSPDQLATHLERLVDFPPAKRDDLIAFYRRWRDRLADRWLDGADLLRTVADRLDADLLARAFPGVDLLLLSGFDTFSPSLRRLLDRLFTLLPRSCVLLDYRPDRSRLFARSEPAFRFLAERASERIEAESPTGTHPGAFLEPHLFTRAAARLPAPVTLLPGADRPVEVERIARQIRRLHRERTVPLDRIRVAFRDPDLYLPFLLETFPRHGIPFHLTRGQPLAHAPIVAGVLAVLDAVQERYARPALLRLLNLPWVEFACQVDGQTRILDADFLDAWSRNLRPSAGRSGWLQALDGRCAYLERELAADHPLTDEIEDREQWLSELNDELEGLRHLRECLTALFARLSPFERSLTLDAFRHRLLRLLGQLGFTRHLQAAEATELTRREALPFARFCQLLDRLASLTPSLSRSRFPLRVLLDLLRTGLDEERLYPAQPTGVGVGGLTEIVGSPCDHLFLGGLVEGEFPRIPATDIFLEDHQRRALGLEEIDDALAADRLLFYRAVATPSEQLYLLYPQREGNTPLSPSSFIEEIENLVDLPPAQEEPALTTLADLCAEIGRDPDQPLTRQSLQFPPLARPVRHLLHGLRLTAERLALDRLGPYDGILAQSQVLDSIQSRLGSGHAFSTSQLETYALCPFRFYAERLLGIGPLPDPEADEFPLEKGNLIHHTLYRFYTRRRNGDLVERVTPDALEAAARQLRADLHHEAEAMNLQGFFWERELERLIGAENGEGREGLLIRFLRLEAEADDPASPAHFELSFGSYPGMGERDPLSTASPFVVPDPETGEEVRLFGKIDRVDRVTDGRFAVYDYKTGQVPSVADIDRGLHLQLPLYLMAAETLFQESGLAQGVAGAYYQLRDLENCGRKGLFASRDHRGEVFAARGRNLPEHDLFRHKLDLARQFLLRYVRAMRRGQFPVTRHSPDRTCVYCPFRQSCRLDHRRMRHLDREGLLP